MKYRYPKISSALTYHRVDDNSALRKFLCKRESKQIRK